MRLAERQREFLDGVYGEAPWPAFAIYRGHAMANLHDALAATYPVVRRLVGEAFFAEAALRFARAHPSRAGDLDEYGESFPAFLERYPHAHSLDYLGDTARLEWACHESGRAAGAAALDTAALARVPPRLHEGLRFDVHPAARVVRSRHPIVSIWRANQPDADGTPQCDAAEDALVTREAHGVRVDRIEAFDASLLEALARGRTLAEATAEFDAQLIGRSLGDALVRYARRGVLCGFHASPAGA
jgi:hypothetical protein